MILLVDAGNSRIKWSLLYKGGRSEQSAQDYTQHAADIILQRLIQKNLEQSSSEKKITRILLVSVLGADFSHKVEQHCQNLKIKLQIVRSTAKAYGVINAYDDAMLLGADRFVGLVAAHHLRANYHCIIVSCGTAITIDAITATGQHLGGLILPGLQSFSENLIKKSALLKTPNSARTTLFATNTADAITSGSIYGLVEAINGISSRMKGKLLETKCLGETTKKMTSVQIILCGGDAKLMHHYLSDSTQREDDWLMQGLQLIAEFTFPSLKK